MWTVRIFIFLRCSVAAMDDPRSAADQPAESNARLERNEETRFRLEPELEALLGRHLPFDANHRANIFWLLEDLEIASIRSFAAVVEGAHGTPRDAGYFTQTLVDEQRIKPRAADTYKAEIALILRAVIEANNISTSPHRPAASRKRAASPSLHSPELSPTTPNKIATSPSGRLVPPKHLDHLNVSHPQYWAFFVACASRLIEGPLQTSKCPCGSVQASMQHYNYVIHLKTACRSSTEEVPVYVKEPQPAAPPIPLPADVASIAALPLAVLLKIPSRYFANWAPEYLAKLPSEVSAGISPLPMSPHPSDSHAAVSAPVPQLALHSQDPSGELENFLIAPGSQIPG